MRRIVLAVLLLASLPAAAQTVTLGRVVDGATIELADGRRLALTGIEAPRGRLAPAAAAALGELAAAAPLELRDAAPPDRHGALRAQLYAGGRWVQQDLVARGLARVRGSADARSGLGALLKAEVAARAAMRGIWVERGYRIRTAEEAGAFAGSFEIVEGQVVSVARTTGAMLLDFGADWRHAFTLRIATAVVKSCRAAGLDPARLAGKRVRVRGFIDGTGRPSVEVGYPEQIELLE